MRRILIVAVVLIGFPTALAHAATHKPYTLPKHAKTCRTHYRKLREHGHIECVWAHKTLIVAPKTTSLAVRLDPDFTVSPTNTLDLTFSYSASATLGTAPDTNLPAGVLEFYSDGLLECSTNVGGDIDGGTCEVVYSDYGDHTTNVIYDSGTNSVTTGPEVVTIPAPPMPALALAAPPPPPLLSTTTTLTVTDGICTTINDGVGAINYPQAGVPFIPVYADRVTYECAYTLAVSATDQDGILTTGLAINACSTITNGSCSFIDSQVLDGPPGDYPDPSEYTPPTPPSDCTGQTETVTGSFAGSTTDAPSTSTPVSVSAFGECAPTNP